MIDGDYDYDHLQTQSSCRFCSPRLWHCVVLSLDASLLSKHAASIFLVEMSGVRMWSDDIGWFNKRCTLKFMRGVEETET
jgi:hypothetical protein